ncbi:MAG: acetyl-CoA carboxylase carboxyltransferase subunit alpha [Chlamydiae bacterium RIFCSPHIGHO2_12_FULL_44_59]|nr:MAG: acetyl-CoA carboxylase carboxyltransferase subunit alpha [Chlamydiae bacterium RIFCSPHIGHO2_01_FULL_44_39]OGN60197.1 MAG: acetyl-CoA carboxylase carboxyltransferase subunit alpha [Chlamydiae bacterium RIFCSPHIGHO2_12_FULL_44_59]OGN67150.1 MAG: acetyl-CoA carboxylase carboxyltransferase subunit alpha [Chlamydiae bacterium RIFCSPLOWO2_01_FULL_44_52]OGN67740.1 MAG: acetyl-CoA carboxylase carboxyltransferase subunit alpha [Chlamydiae bacterium RIFCSPLOWO2_02_FULL_45_22]OGN71443.1 MAG: acety
MTILPHEKQIFEVEETLSRLKEQNKGNPLFSQDELVKLEKKLQLLKERTYSQLKPWDRVQICRHPRRPHAIDYMEAICDEFVELFGDRTFADDHAIISGCGLIDGQKFVIIGQEKGKDTESRIYRNFGMPHPEGYRKAMRCMKLAAKFNLPVISFVDTPGAYPGLSAEERGQGWVIAQNLWEMARLPTPIIVVLIGEGCSGGALGIGAGDAIGMMEHSYYSVISPEGCASILWKDASKNSVAASALKMHVEDLLGLGIIDQKIDEPLGGAHLNPKQAFQNVKSFILEQWEAFKATPISSLLENRYQKFRKMGKFDSHVKLSENHEALVASCPSEQ